MKVLQIEHRHGTNFYICESDEVVQIVLRHYVADWWKMEMGEPLPKPMTGADIERYFEMANESWTVSDYSEPITLEHARTFYPKGVQ